MNHLFARKEAYNYFRNKESELKKEINSLTKTELENSDDSLKLILLAKHTIKPIELDDYYQVDKGEIQLDISNDRRFAAAFFKDLGRGPVLKTGRQVEIHIPFTGDSDLFNFRPSSFTTVFPKADILNSELILQFRFFSDVDKPEEVKRSIDKEIALITRYVNWMNKDISSFNNGITTIVEREIPLKRDKLFKDEDFLGKLGIPEKEKSISKGFIKPEKKIELKILTQEKEKDVEPGLEMETYDEIIRFVNDLRINLERTSRRLRDLDEESLRDAMLMALNSVYRGMASGEAFNKEGKTDILIRYQDRNLFIAECKIWRNEKYFLDGIDQLLSYLTWRDSKTSYIIFSKNVNVSKVIKNTKTLTKKHPNYLKEISELSDSCIRYRFKQVSDETKECLMTLHVFDLGQ